jgi:hypothetical protein
MLNVVAERRGTLASYEVAGVGEQNEFVPRGTMESGGRFHRPVRTNFAWGRKPGTLCRANFRCSFGAENAGQQLDGILG